MNDMQSWTIAITQNLVAALIKVILRPLGEWSSARRRQ